jgi:ATP-dependent helicase HrpA
MYRLDRLADRLPRDREASRTVDALASELAARQGREAAHDLEHVRWLIEELRVSLFAQHLGTSEPVSARRVRAALDAATS